MTPAELIATLGPSRLPVSMLEFGPREYLAVAGLGLLAGLAVGLLLRPFTRRGPSQRQRLRATRGQPGQDRILSIARILGRLPPALRGAAYRAGDPPSDIEIERLLRGRE